MGLKFCRRPNKDGREFEKADVDTSFSERRRVQELVEKTTGEERDPQEFDRIDNMDLDIVDEEEI